MLFNDTPVDDFADASKTTRNFVVELSVHSEVDLSQIYVEVACALDQYILAWNQNTFFLIG